MGLDRWGPLSSPNQKRLKGTVPGGAKKDSPTPETLCWASVPVTVGTKYITTSCRKQPENCAKYKKQTLDNGRHME